MTDPTRLAVLISGRGSNLRSLINACASNLLPASIELVVTNVANAPGLDIAKEHGIQTRVIPHLDYPDRESFDEALLAIIEDHAIDILVLAGFMRILTASFTEFWYGRMINIHPSLLPEHAGLNTHVRALAAGDKQSGASVHFVTPELDGGPVILQGAVDIEPDDTAATLSNRVLDVERIIYPIALEWLVNGRITLQSEQCYLDGKELLPPPRWYNNQLHLQSTN